MSNPWLSLWLSAANSWAGAARGFWAAELRRQQSALVDEIIRQNLRLWTQALGLPDTARRPDAAAEPAGSARLSRGHVRRGQRGGPRLGPASDAKTPSV